MKSETHVPLVRLFPFSLLIYLDAFYQLLLVPLPSESAFSGGEVGEKTDRMREIQT